MLVMERCIDSSLRAYCPYKDCSCLLERPDEEDEAAAGGQDFPFECPACQRTFCLSCSITGWHMVRKFEKLVLRLHCKDCIYRVHAALCIVHCVCLTEAGELM
jgi:hypothetical protein